MIYGVGKRWIDARGKYGDGEVAKNAYTRYHASMVVFKKNTGKKGEFYLFLETEDIL